jgi:hypothetical protein
MHLTGACTNKVKEGARQVPSFFKPQQAVKLHK